jgi:hypothetical protein
VTHKLTLNRNNDNILATATEHGVTIFIGWTVGIPPADAIDYVKSYNSSPNKGFFEHDGKVALSHGPAKIMLSEQEASAIVGLIKTAYGVV